MHFICVLTGWPRSNQYKQIKVHLLVLSPCFPASSLPADSWQPPSLCHPVVGWVGRCVHLVMAVRPAVSLLGQSLQTKRETKNNNKIKKSRFVSCSHIPVCISSVCVCMHICCGAVGRDGVPSTSPHRPATDRTRKQEASCTPQLLTL